MKLKTAARGGGGPDATILNTRLHELLEAGKKQIVLDLSHVKVMNSSGLGLLIGGVSAVKNAGGRLTLAGASAKLSAVFTISKLGPLLELYPTVDAAARSYKT